MIKILKQEIPFEKTLKQKLEFICEFCKTTPTFINGSIRKINKSNLNYVEPHRIIGKHLFFIFIQFVYCFLYVLLSGTLIIKVVWYALVIVSNVKHTE